MMDQKKAKKFYCAKFLNPTGREIAFENFLKASFFGISGSAKSLRNSPEQILPNLALKMCLSRQTACSSKTIFLFKYLNRNQIFDYYSNFLFAQSGPRNLLSSRI